MKSFTVVITGQKSNHECFPRLFFRFHILPWFVDWYYSYLIKEMPALGVTADLIRIINKINKKIRILLSSLVVAVNTCGLWAGYQVDHEHVTGHWCSRLVASKFVCWPRDYVHFHVSITALGFIYSVAINFCKKIIYICLMSLWTFYFECEGHNATSIWEGRK